MTQLPISSPINLRGERLSPLEQMAAVSLTLYEQLEAKGSHTIIPPMSITAVKTHGARRDKALRVDMGALPDNRC